MKNAIRGWRGALLLALLSGSARPGAAQAGPVAAPPDSANLVLVTIDGLRWQELFDGADARLLRRDPAGKVLRRRYGQATAPLRRRALFPFLWDSIGRRGQLLGNRKLGNYQDVANGRRLSYPGYNELLTGAADDQRIRNNRNLYNPNETLLEVVNRRPDFAGRVAAFTSWEAFPFILNQPRSGLPVNAGLNGHERPDSLTYQAARQYLVRTHPRVLYLSFGNTDTFAHGGHYGDYLAAAHVVDAYLAELWTVLQALPQYRGRTTLLVTTDHGRGRGRFWTLHGREFRASAHTWVAAVGPGIPAAGEVSVPGQQYQARLAAQLARCLGVTYPAGPAPVVPTEVATGLLGSGAGE